MFASVIIPTYNGERLLVPCLEALRAQEYPRECWEIIVVDDASRDGTRARLASEYPEVQVVVLPTNRGLAAACNAGAAVARGEALVMLNNDTEVEPGWLAALLEPLAADPTVGAVAAKMLAARFNREGLRLVDHRVYGICSDGDLMEGVSSEAASLAGHLGLDNLIYLYDDNRITIDGSTDLTFTEDRAKRFEAYGWFVQEIDGHDLGAIVAALDRARATAGRPQVIVARTVKGKGVSFLEGVVGFHGKALTRDELARALAELDGVGAGR